MKEKKLDDIDRKVIREYANGNMKSSYVARRIFVHRNTIEYRFKRIESITGLDPTKFWDLVKLNEMLDAEENWNRLKGE